MASLARAEAVRGPSGRPIPSLSAVALARRCIVEMTSDGVDPVIASQAGPNPWLLRR